MVQEAFPFATLRTLLEGPSAANWGALIALFDTPEAPVSSDFGVGLDYAVEHLASWPDALRVFPAERDLLKLPAGHPLLRLCRALHVRDTFEGSEGLRALLSSPYVGKLTELSVSWETPLLGQGRQSEHTIALAQSPNLSAFRHLRMTWSGQQGHLGQPSDYTAPGEELWSFLSHPNTKLTNLRSLSTRFRPLIRQMGYTSLSIEGLGAHAMSLNKHLTKLEELDLYDQNIKDRGAVCLASSAHLPRLWRLDLHRNNIGPEGLLALANATPPLRWLNLSANRLDRQTIEAFRRCDTLQRLEHLDLCGMQLGDDEAVLLARNKHLANLRSFAIGASTSYNRIGPRGAHALATSESLRRLTSLDLSHNPITVQGASAIAESSTLQLQQLDLSGAECGDDGAIALANSPALAQLTTLNLSFNRLHEDGVLALAHSPHLQNLRTLDLSLNPLSPKAREAIAFSPTLCNAIRRPYLTAYTVKELHTHAKSRKIRGYSTKNKRALIELLLQH